MGGIEVAPYCPFTVHSCSGRYRRRRRGETEENCFVFLVIHSICCRYLLALGFGSATGNRTRVFRLRI